MARKPASSSVLVDSVRPLTPGLWPDLRSLLGERGCGGCWCLWWRVTMREFSRGAAANEAAMKALVDSGRRPGLLAYSGGKPVGWCSVAPREEFGRLERSRVLARVDDRPVWSVVCFYVDRRLRGRGVASRLLEEAVRYAASRGARIVEAYPKDTRGARGANAELYPGSLAMYRKAGFVEVARRSPGRAIVRKELRALSGLRGA